MNVAAPEEKQVRAGERQTWHDAEQCVSKEPERKNAYPCDKVAFFRDAILELDDLRGFVEHLCV